MSCQDCLIWVGKQAYTTIEMFVTEAEDRGCSRQIPAWPNWAVPGRTRVFLAHRHRYARQDKGVIFGYFTLRGVDVILNQNDCDLYKDHTAAHRKTPGGKRDPKSLRGFWRKPEGVASAAPLIDFWRERFPRSPSLPCRLPPKSGKPDEGLEDDAIDFLLDFLISCEPVGPGDSPTGTPGGYGISSLQTFLEEGRWCGLREGQEKGRPAHAPDASVTAAAGTTASAVANATTVVAAAAAPPSVESPPDTRPPAFYFVDELTREIDELFCALLKELVKAALSGEEEGKEKKKGRAEKKRPKGSEEKESREAWKRILLGLREQASEKLDRRRQKGVPQFREAVRRAHASKKEWAELPEDIGRVADRRGALVVFKEPYPAFEKAPRAEFLGVLRIDGDQLLKDVIAFYEKEGAGGDVKLPYCDGPDDGPNGGETKRQRALAMAQKFDVSVAVAGKILDWLTLRVTETLQGRRRFNLHGVGTFRTRKKGNVVRFIPSKKLKDAVEKDDNE